MGTSWVNRPSHGNQHSCEPDFFESTQPDNFAVFSSTDTLSFTLSERKSGSIINLKPNLATQNIGRLNTDEEALFGIDAIIHTRHHASKRDQFEISPISDTPFHPLPEFQFLSEN